MRLMRIFPVMAAVAVLTLSVALPAGATAALAPTGSHKACPPHAVTLPGGLCAVHALGKRLADAPNLGGLQDLGTVNIVNFSHDTYGITDNPTNVNGMLANHLYMWAISSQNWSTQIWTMWFDNSNDTYVFQSTYNGSLGNVHGGVAYGCINVPGVTKSSGVQLIVYSCSGIPNNERFIATPLASTSDLADELQANYSPYLKVGIGNNFPGNGPWVITWSGSVDSNSQWQFVAPGGTL